MVTLLLKYRLIVVIVTAILVGWGIVVAPFDWKSEWLWRDPVPVDAIPDIGENQQIVFTDWAGRSPQDVEDQVTYPLSVALLGLPGVKSTRSYSMFGFSLIYVIFEDGIDFYWSRTRVLESLNALPANELPEGVKPTLGPDATALGQVFWYTLEGQDDRGNPTGGWDLHELRTIQDWYVRYALRAVPGVSEVASVGGFVQEYQIDVDPDRMRYRNVSLEEVVDAVRKANVDVGARTIEVNKVEYVIRGLGFFKNLEHIENSLIKMEGDIPILVGHVANVTRGPAERRGALDKNGDEAVGGVVVVRYGENPLAVIGKVKEKIAEISLGLPKRELPDGTTSQVRIVPFYDRTNLILETLGTLRSALSGEMLVTAIVIIVMMEHIGASILISGLLPLAVLLCFVAMKLFGVDANIVALSGIAIAIGNMVDMGIILMENIHRHFETEGRQRDRLSVIIDAGREVSGAILTAVATTVVSFLPVFTMVAAEGKLFRPLAFTKTFALLASLMVALALLPALASLFFGRPRKHPWRAFFDEGLIYLGAFVAVLHEWPTGALIALLGVVGVVRHKAPPRFQPWLRHSSKLLVVCAILILLADDWRPLGESSTLLSNALCVGLTIGAVLAGLGWFQRRYAPVLGWCLVHKKVFLTLPVIILLLGVTIWQGFDRVTGWLPWFMQRSRPAVALRSLFPGLGTEFMPPLDEGAFLYMPVTMPHASIGEVLDILQRQDRAIESLPEIELAVGKLGRTESPLDPAPVSMIETVINYRPEYHSDASGKPLRYKFEPDETDYFRGLNGNPVAAPDGLPYRVDGRFARDESHQLIPDPRGRPFRLWRPALEPRLNQGREAWHGIRSPADIWELIIRAATLPGTTVAPKLQPISARMVMLQSGIRANMGVKIYGTDLANIEAAGRQIEKQLREVDSIDPQSVIADRIIGKPYLEIHIDRRAIAQYGINLQQVQDVIEVAIGGEPITRTVEGRERYPVRVRYLRELRDHLDTIGKILVPSPNGAQIPLIQLADIRYKRGPQEIKGEGSFHVGYVLFDKKAGFADGEVVAAAREQLMGQIQSGALKLAEGVTFAFTGNYENQMRAEKKLRLILPLTLVIIFIILYLQFRSVATSALLFSGIPVAWSGGFIMIWLYGQPWFLDVSIFDVSLRELLQVHPINLSVAVWVGFLALFGIASDDGVVMATYLESTFSHQRPQSIAQIRQATIAASLKRVRPCLMTNATTILALLPVLTSRGRGSDIMIPMAIPTFGGLVVELISMLIVPVLYCAVKENKAVRTGGKIGSSAGVGLEVGENEYGLK
jgi:Cu(I)/Ag(I) efflux system membrane protein CusA/SilA